MIKKEDRENLTLLKYEITYDPLLQDKNLKKLPLSIRRNLVKLYDNTIMNPGETIPKLKELVTKYPDVPVLYNYLSSAYSAIGDHENAEIIVLKNYKKHPDYLFAKINYAHICLEKEDFGKIPEIFDEKYELKLLYPKRSKFHISEVISFYGIMCLYFINIGESKNAIMYYKILKELDPKHKTTRIVKRILYPSLLRRIIYKLVKKLEGSKKKHEINHNNQNNLL